VFFQGFACLVYGLIYRVLLLGSRLNLVISELFNKSNPPGIRGKGRHDAVDTSVQRESCKHIFWGVAGSAWRTCREVQLVAESQAFLTRQQSWHPSGGHVEPPNTNECCPPLHCSYPVQKAECLPPQQLSVSCTKSRMWHLAARRRNLWIYHKWRPGVNLPPPPHTPCHHHFRLGWQLVFSTRDLVINLGCSKLMYSMYEQLYILDVNAGEMPAIIPAFNGSCRHYHDV